MPSITDIRPLTFKQMAAARFADRPTLRQVLAISAFEAIVQRYPWTRQNHPHLQSADALSVVRAAGPGQPSTRNLVDTLLEHFVSGQKVTLVPSDYLSLAPPLIFRAQDHSPVIELNPVVLNTVFDERLATLSEAFQLAQISFWNGGNSDTEVSPITWLEQLIKGAWLQALKKQGLTAADEQCVHDLIDQASTPPVAYALQVSLAQEGEEHKPLLPDVLLSQRTGSGQGFLWCKPSGSVRRYVNLEAFAQDLHRDLCERYTFSAWSWARMPLSRPVFAYQAEQLLNVMLQRIAQVQLGSITDVAHLERVYAELSDPCTAFNDYAHPPFPGSALPLPDWLANADAQDRLAYAQALLQLSSGQSQAEDTSSLQGIESLSTYTTRRLREQMLADHPGTPPSNPEHIVISLSERVQVSTEGPWQLRFVKTISLPELAITRLRPATELVVSAVQSATAHPLAPWVTLTYVDSLISTVDVAGQYPAYVHGLLNDSASKSLRVQHFGKEWRASLLLCALKAKIDGALGERSYQAVTDYCQGQAHAQDNLQLAPLAFFCARGAKRSNRAHGMYLIKLNDPQSWLLYRPWLSDAALREFAGPDQLMESLRSDLALQRSVLAWMSDEARPIYDNGGFTHPHLYPTLEEIAALLNPLGLTALDAIRAPAALDFKPWADHLDQQLYDDKALAMLLLASRQSTSNAELRWDMVVECAWLAFNVVTTPLRGPAATVVWLVTTALSLNNDLAVLGQGSEQSDILAATDILLSVAMLLMHKTPAHSPSPLPPDERLVRITGPAKRQPASGHSTSAPQPATWEAVPVHPESPAYRVTRWGDSQRLANLSAQARAALSQLRARPQPQAPALQTSGRLRGLYKAEEHCYVNLQGTFYEVEETFTGIRIIGSDTRKGEWTDRWGGDWDGYLIVGRERDKGPWVVRRNGEWVIDLSLAGGMPKSRQAVMQENRKALAELQAKRAQNDAMLVKYEALLDRNSEQVKPLDDAAKALRLLLEDYPGVSLENLPEPVQTQMDELQAMRRSLRSQLQVLVLTHEKQAEILTSQVQVLGQMSEPRFARQDPSGLAAYGLGQWWEQLLNNDVHMIHRLLELTDYTQVQTQSLTLASLPFGEEYISVYQAYRDTLQPTLALHQRILAATERLDRNLVEALLDNRIQFAGKQTKIDKIIARRKYSTVITRAQVLSDLSQLVIDRERLTAESFDELLRMQADLRSLDFKEALLSHNSIPSADLPLDEQVEVLNNALREYRIARTKASYLLSLNDPALNIVQLEAYIREMGALESQAERELSNTLRERDDGAVAIGQPVTYRERKGKRKLIRTSRGRAILVEQNGDGSQALLNDPVTEQTTSQYQRQGDAWEQVPAPPVIHGPAYLRRVGTRLLGRKAAQIALASRYTNEPNSLADLLDWHMQDMSDIAQRLHAGPADGHALAGQLDQAIADMQAEKRRLLTDAYLNTRHPDSTALRYLIEQDQVQVTLVKARKRLSTNDYLAVYTIDRKQPRQPLWEAHFHYTQEHAAPRAFAKGHLKFSEPRGMGRDEQLQRALDPAERIRIYRGDLRLRDIEGLIPFPDS
jgi:hypothetical protein